MKHNLLLRSVALGTFYSNGYEIHELKIGCQMSLAPVHPNIFPDSCTVIFTCKYKCNAHIVKPCPERIQTQVILHISATVQHIVSYHTVKQSIIIPQFYTYSCFTFLKTHLPYYSIKYYYSIGEVTKMSTLLGILEHHKMA